MDGRPVKEIQLPVLGTVGINKVRKIVDHELFQRLRRRLQLGEVGVVYPGGCGSRFTHSLLTYKLALERTRRLVEWKHISKQDAADVETFALVHDIGHGPRSHITDPLVQKGHEERGHSLLFDIADEIIASGADLQRVAAMMKREDPLHTIVTHTPLGVDKLAYLTLDAQETGLGGMPNEGIFMDHVYYHPDRPEGLVVDYKIAQEALLLSEFYRTMYERVYYRTATAASERFIQRLISILLGQTGDPAEFNEDQLTEMTDVDLDYRLAHAKNPLVRQQLARYSRRQQPYPAIIFKVPPYHLNGWMGTHTGVQVEMEASVLEQPELGDPGTLYGIERRIELALNLVPLSVLVVPPLPARRFLPHNYAFKITGGVGTLSQLRQKRWELGVEDSQSYARLYVCANPELCDRLIIPEAVATVRSILQNPLNK